MLIHTGSRAWYETIRLAVRNRRKRENLRAKEAEHAQGCVEGPLLSVKLAFPSAGARGFAPRIALNERTTAVLLKTSSFLAIYNLRRRRCPAFSPGNHSLPVYVNTFVAQKGRLWGPKRVQKCLSSYKQSKFPLKRSGNGLSHLLGKLNLC